MARLVRTSGVRPLDLGHCVGAYSRLDRHLRPELPWSELTIWVTDCWTPPPPPLTSFMLHRALLHGILMLLACQQFPLKHVDHQGRFRRVAFPVTGYARREAASLQAMRSLLEGSCSGTDLPKACFQKSCSCLFLRLPSWPLLFWLFLLLPLLLLL